jgi:hypothetical protein
VRLSSKSSNLSGVCALVEVTHVPIMGPTRGIYRGVFALSLIRERVHWCVRAGLCTSAKGGILVKPIHQSGVILICCSIRAWPHRCRPLSPLSHVFAAPVAGWSPPAAGGPRRAAASIDFGD